MPFTPEQLRTIQDAAAVLETAQFQETPPPAAPPVASPEEEDGWVARLQAAIQRILGGGAAAAPSPPADRTRAVGRRVEEVAGPGTAAPMRTPGVGD